MKWVHFLLLPGAALAISGIPLYAGPWVTGDIGDRATSTALCAAALPTWLTWCGNTPALISYSDSPARSLVDESYALPIISLTANPVADNWTMLWSGGLIMDMRSSGVLSSRFFYTGTEADGSMSERNCADWTSADGAVSGRAGAASLADDRWTSVGDSRCNLPRPLVCVCTLLTNAPTRYPTPNPTEE